LDQTLKAAFAGGTFRSTEAISGATGRPLNATIAATTCPTGTPSGYLMGKQEARLHRQFDAITRIAPPSRRIIHAMLYGRLRMIRLPIACLLILAAFLPSFRSSVYGCSRLV
jgi:hypothetical protein